MSDPIEILTAFFAAPDDEARCDELVAAADRVIDAMEEPSAELQALLDTTSRALLIRAYETLAGQDAPPIAPDETLIEAARSEAADIGEAFADTLLAGLNRSIEVLRERCAGLRAGQTEALAGRCPSVDAAGPEFAFMAEAGLSPVRVLKALNAIGGLLQRDVAYGDLPQRFQARIATGVEVAPPPKDAPKLDSQALAAEVVTMTEVGQAASEVLVDWLFEWVLSFRPFALDGFVAIRSADAVELAWAGVKHEDRRLRWAEMETAAAWKPYARSVDASQTAADVLARFRPAMLLDCGGVFVASGADLAPVRISLFQNAIREFSTGEAAVAVQMLAGYRALHGDSEQMIAELRMVLPKTPVNGVELALWWAATAKDSRWVVHARAVVAAIKAAQGRRSEHWVPILENVGA